MCLGPTFEGNTDYPDKAASAELLTLPLSSNTGSRLNNLAELGIPVGADRILTADTARSEPFGVRRLLPGSGSGGGGSGRGRGSSRGRGRD
jgi:hypothetical protein